MQCLWYVVHVYVARVNMCRRMCEGHLKVARIGMKAMTEARPKQQISTIREKSIENSAANRDEGTTISLSWK